MAWLVSGDILDVCENFMVRACEGTGVSMVRPLWEKPRGAILNALSGFDFIITCCNLKKMKRELAEDLMLKRGPEVLKTLLRLADENGKKAALLFIYLSIYLVALGHGEVTISGDGSMDVHRWRWGEG